jgi:HAD superfamily hydrolase (TIGR01490 family)
LYEEVMTVSRIKIAALDVDGTLFPHAIGARLFEELASTGVCSWAFVEEVANLLRHYKAGELAHPDMTERATSIYAAAIGGVKVADVMAAAREVWRREEVRLFPFARDLIALLRESGFTPLLISASPEEIVALLARSLGDVGFRAARFEAVAGSYTGCVESMPSLPGQKRRMVEEFVGGASIDLTSSVAIGNSLGDESMLSLVGHAIAFEPDISLRQVAVARGWTLADRHDVLQRVREQIGR